MHKKELDDTAIDAIVDKVFEEIDLDGDARLSFVEFQQLVSRLPNFEK